MPFNSFRDLVGHTPCVRYKTPESKNARIFVKIEGQNPTGSIKDRACVYNILGAIESGELKAGKTILDASSGNMACSLVYFGAVLGYPVDVVCSSKLTADKAAFIKYFGGKLHQHGTFTIECAQYCRDVLVANAPGKYAFLDQLHNWNNPKAHYETTGPEILSEFPNVAAVVASLGSGGTFSGLARYLKEKRPSTKTVSVECASGNKIPGVGTFVDGDYVTPFIAQIERDGMLDQRVTVDLESSMRRISDMRSQGFYCGMQTGAVVEAAVRFIASAGLEGDVVVLSGDAGWKNMDKLGSLC